MANEALDSIKEFAEKLKTLEIVTMVTAIQEEKTTQDGASQVSFVPAEGKVNKGCVTKIDLIGGDIRTYIGDGMTDEEYQRITAFHSQQVEKGQQVIERTVLTLKDLAKAIRDLAA